MFDLVIIADWSSEQGRKPTPQENRCWIAWGTPRKRSEPAYMPTRLEATAQIRSVLEAHPDARALVGFDFAIGYPLADGGEAVLPIGRELCAMVDKLVTDDPSGNNNRFHAAGKLNEQIAQSTGKLDGPFWGRPTSLDVPGLHVRRPTDTGVRKLRSVEHVARSLSKSKPKSPWQLAGIGSVGGQSLVGLKAVAALLDRFNDRAHLWPFEPTPDRPDAVTIAEVYPSLFEARSPSYWYKDARQVIDTRDAVLDHPDQPSLLTTPEIAKCEGWILGVDAAASPSPTADA